MVTTVSGQMGVAATDIGVVVPVRDALSRTVPAQPAVRDTTRGRHGADRSGAAAERGRRGRRVTGVHRADRPGEGRSPVGESALLVPTAEAMRQLGRSIGRLLRAGDVVLLSGDLGAGKTTLAQGIGAALDVVDEVTSPTFVIARIHASTEPGLSLVHVDAYRLGRPAEVDDLDLDADLDESVTVVEWGEGLVEHLASDRLEVRIRRPRGDRAGSVNPDDLSIVGDEPRTVSVLAYGERWVGVTLPAPAS